MVTIFLEKRVRLQILGQLQVFTVVDRNPDNHWSGYLQCFLKCRCDLVRMVDIHSLCAESFRELHEIDRSKVHAGSTTILRYFLEAHHVVAAIDPHDVYEIAFQTDGRFQLWRGE